MLQLKSNLLTSEVAESSVERLSEARSQEGHLRTFLFFFTGGSDEEATLHFCDWHISF